jgi:hypothetical protein
MSGATYFAIGRWVGLITAGLTFVACWIYCIAHYGFLVGVGIGWLPSAIAAVIVGGLVMVLWGLVAVGVAASLLFWWNSANEQRAASTANEWNVVATAPPADAAAVPTADAAAAPPVIAAPASTPWQDYSSSRAATSGGPYAAEHGISDCTEDCSGHEAGYAWAERNGIDEEDDCTGNSDSFIEGCKAYVEDEAS